MEKIGNVRIKIQIKTKTVEFAQEFLIKAVNCLCCLLGLNFMGDQEFPQNIAALMLHSTKNWTELTILAQLTIGVENVVIGN